MEFQNKLSPKERLKIGIQTSFIPYSIFMIANFLTINFLLNKPILTENFHIVVMIFLFISTLGLMFDFFLLNIENIIKVDSDKIYVYYKEELRISFDVKDYKFYYDLRTCELKTQIQNASLFNLNKFTIHFPNRKNELGEHIEHLKNLGAKTIKISFKQRLIESMTIISMFLIPMVMLLIFYKHEYYNIVYVCSVSFWGLISILALKRTFY